jgi:negative regulator of sigma E activity
MRIPEGEEMKKDIRNISNEMIADKNVHVLGEIQIYEAQRTSNSIQGSLLGML